MEYKDTQALKFFKIKLCFIGIITIQLFSGCFISPGDGAEIKNSADYIDFSGYFNKPRQTILLKARNSCGELDVIAEAKTSDKLSTNMSYELNNEQYSMPLYAWSVRAQIPLQYWEKSEDNRYKAIVRAETPEVKGYAIFQSHTLRSFTPDFYDCLAKHNGNIQIAYDECQSENSPNMVIYAEAHQIEEVEFNQTESESTSRCIDGLIAQVKGERRLRIDQNDSQMRLRHPRSGLLKKFKKHNQGISRLKDWNDRARIIHTNNYHGGGLRLNIQNENDREVELFTQNNPRLEDRRSFSIRSKKHGHPGGIQAHGDIVAIAMEHDKKKKDAAVYFLRVTGDEFSFIDTFKMGINGEPLDLNRKSAENVGFVKQRSGKYLLAVSGSHYGQVIWFYESEQTEIVKGMKWKFIDLYRPKTGCRGFGSSDNDCFYNGASGGLNLHVGCNGTIYLIALQGSASSSGKENEAVQIFEVKKCNKIKLEKVHQEMEEVGAGALLERSFRWAAGSYVMPNGILALINTERRTSLDKNKYIDCHIYIGKK